MFSWWRKRQRQKRLDSFRQNFWGKSSGWDLILRTDMAQPESAAWKNYTAAELEAVYKLSSIVHACVWKICMAAREAELVVGAVDETGKWRMLSTHPMLTLLRNPGPELSHIDYQARVLSSLLLTGASYTYQVRNGAGITAELQPLPTSWVQKEKDTNGEKYYSVFQGSGNPRARVNYDDIVAITLIDPAHPEKFCSPLQAALRDYQTDTERENYIIEMLTNTRPPGMILKQRQGWTTEQKGNIRKVLEDKLGPGRRGSPLLLSGEDASIEIPNPLADLDWPGLTSLSETRICAAFGVPPIIIHLRSGLERSTYANYAVALKAFYETTMVPIWIMLQESFTKGLLRDEGDEVSSFWYDTSKVKALQVDEAMLADRAVKLFQGGLITRNKAREMIGEDTLPPEIGDVFVLPAGLIETPVTLPSIGEGEHLVEWEAGA